jgi:hypothetical protein
MKTYLLMWSYYDSWHIHGIFSSKEKAEEAIREVMIEWGNHKRSGQLEILEYAMDEVDV